MKKRLEPNAKRAQACVTFCAVWQAAFHLRAVGIAPAGTERATACRQNGGHIPTHALRMHMHAPPKQENF